MSISYRICTQISKDGDIWTDKTGYRSDIKETVSAKRGRNHRRQSVPGPYTHADKHPTQVQRILVYKGRKIAVYGGA